MADKKKKEPGPFDPIDAEYDKQFKYVVKALRNGPLEPGDPQYRDLIAVSIKMLILGVERLEIMLNTPQAITRLSGVGKGKWQYYVQALQDDKKQLQELLDHGDLDDENVVRAGFRRHAEFMLVKVQMARELYGAGASIGSN